MKIVYVGKPSPSDAPVPVAETQTHIRSEGGAEEVIQDGPWKRCVEAIVAGEMVQYFELMRTLDARQMQFALTDVASRLIALQQLFDFSQTEKGIATAQKVIDLAKQLKASGANLPKFEALLNGDEP